MSHAVSNDVVYALRQIAKAYEGQSVLQIQALDVRRGEVLAIVGPSGAGKSTLLRLLNFIELQDAGDLRYHDQPYGPGQPMALAARRQVTTVFQRPILLNSSVAANVAHGLRLRGQRDVHPRVGAALERVGLAHMAHRRARTLSGGEAQRVALARAIVLEPEVLLLDEPTANLDPYNGSIIEDIVRTLNRERGTTCVIVTHNIFQARRLATRIGLLLDGQLIEIADAETFTERPSDRRTAAFVRGDMVY